MNTEVIARLVDTFYSKVREDNVLGPIFTGAIGDDWAPHLAIMRGFWSSVMLGSAAYKGNPLAAHLRMPFLSEAHFERWLNLWRASAAEVCGAGSAIFVERAEAIAARLLAAAGSRASANQTSSLVAL